MPKNEMKITSIRSDIDKVDSIETKKEILELIRSNAAAKSTIVSDVKIQDNIPASFMLVKGPEGTNSEKTLAFKEENNIDLIKADAKKILKLCIEHYKKEPEHPDKKLLTSMKISKQKNEYYITNINDELKKLQTTPTPTKGGRRTIKKRRQPRTKRRKTHKCKRKSFKKTKRKSYKRTKTN